MLMTKRYEYMLFDNVRVHPDVMNHRALNARKVAHYAQDILKNGLLEPLIVWEKKPGEYYLVGGFHRTAAIRCIREKNPGYFDRVDVRIVAGDLDEIRALNIKLNADRLDAKISDYFDAVIYLNNANWSKEKIASFLDKHVELIEEIVHFVPGMDARVRQLLETEKISWPRTKAICKLVMDAPAGQERATLERLLAEAADPAAAAAGRPRRVLPIHKARARLQRAIQKNAGATYSLKAEDLLALLLVLEGKRYADEHLARVRRLFPVLLDHEDAGAN